jgi:hypothetical protein
LLLTDIQDKKHSSSVHRNAVLSAVDQSSSTTSDIIALMSSSNVNHISVDDDGHFMSTTTTVFSNLSLLSTSLSTTPQKGIPIFNIMLLIGCIIAGIIIMIITYMIVKYCNRDEGTYKIDESSHFPPKSSLNDSVNNSCTGKISSSSHYRQKLLTTNEKKMDDLKEWYV